MSNRLFADIYEGTPSFDASAYKGAGHVIVAVKASEGHTLTDSKHKEYCHAAHQHGLSVIHYHFARPDDGNTPEQEAENFIASMGSDLHDGDWIALDFERFRTGGTVQRDPGQDVDWINAFWSYVHDKLGREHLPNRSWLYASRSVLDALVGTGRLVIKRLWDAEWGTGPDLTRVVGKRRYYTIARQRSGDGIGPLPHSLTGVGGSVCDVDELAESAVPHR